MFGLRAKPPELREDAWDEPPYGTLLLRRLKLADRREWHAVRRANRDWLIPWEATVPFVEGEPHPTGGTYSDYLSALNASARAGESFMWGMFVDDRFAGQISLGSISYGSLRNAHIGYWVSREFAGRGITPTAVAMIVDYAFQELKLHRVEINIRPENRASLRVAEKLGLRFEGLRERYLHINGQWADHNAYAITVEECGLGMMHRWRNG